MKTKIENLIIEFFSNSTSALEIAEKLNINDNEEVKQILCEAEKDWEKAPCNSDGATAGQQMFLDLIIEKTTNDIFKLTI